MALTASLIPLPEVLPLESDALAGDTIDYGAWLLPPVAPTAFERVVRAVSTAAGPIALTAAFAFVFDLLF